MKNPNNKEFIKSPLDNVRHCLERANMEQEQKNLLLEYMTSMRTGDGCRPQKNDSIRNSISTLYKLGVFLQKPFKEADKSDIIDFIDTQYSHGKKESSIALYKSLIKQFYIWLFNGEVPQQVSWIKKMKINRKLDKTQLFNPSEIHAVVDIADSSRDKALIAGLYESACRISEWLGIKMGNIMVDDHGIKINVSGKTGERTVRLIDTVPYLQPWIEDHPYNKDPDSPLFISLASNYYGQRLWPSSVVSILRTYTKRAGINKKITPHLLRHSRLTWLAEREKFNERDLRIVAGWSANSDMPNTYLHYGEAEVDQKLRAIRGLGDEKNHEAEMREREAMQKRVCTRCGLENPSTALYCNCGMVLDPSEAMKIEDLKKQAIDQAMEEFMKIAGDSERMRRFEEFKLQSN